MYYHNLRLTKMKQKDINTKDIILTESIEMLNRDGVMDFRIDDLAKRLSLSPGNITYHFSRKEDLFSGIWDRFQNEVSGLELFITKLIDIKVFYLYIKALITLTHKYRGIVMYNSCNLKQVIEAHSNPDSVNSILEHQLSTIFDHLVNNHIFDNTHESSIRLRSIASTQMLILLWQNREVLEGVECDSDQSINFNSLLILFNFKLFFTKKALEQFEELEMAVRHNQI